MSKRILISENRLKELYDKKGLSSYKIAKIYRCDPSVIQRRLKEFNIQIRYPKTKINISKEMLKKLYWNKGLSSYKIAKKMKIGRTTVYNKLIEHGIKTRPKKIVKIDKKELKHLYHNKKMSLSEIAKIHNCTSSIILDKMRKYGIKTRGASESNTNFPKKRFSGNLSKKAYMIGFRLGDLKAIQSNQECNVVISSNTTKIEQFNLIKKVFGCYGHFYSKKRNNIFSLSCQLDKSFGFLVPKKDEIESWILNDKDCFWAFLAGYTDAEGNIGVYDGRARFRVGSYDKKLLYQIYNKLNILGIHTKYRLDTKAGTNKQNEDFWRVSVNHKLSLLKLFEMIRPYLKHEKRINDLKGAKENILERNAKYGIGRSWVKMSKKFYVTTPIYYINYIPSVGSAYTTIIADVLARWHRLAGDKVFYLTGLDENSVKTVQAAKSKNTGDIQAYADGMAKKWKDVWKILNISNDGFIRTTEERHKKTVINFFTKVFRRGDIYKGKYEGLYCEGCEAFLTENDLVNGECPAHKKPPKKISEENYFFRLSNYQDKLLDYIEKNPDFVKPKSKRNEIVSFIKGGLKDVSISRPNLIWGISLPTDKKHRFWVWFDALLNYISGVPKEYWPADLHIIGKDILRFHCAIWPAMLMSVGYALPKTVFAHGFFTVNGQKISKSLGNAIDPVHLSKKYSTDSLRYFLIREIPFGEDGDFSEEALKARINGELVSDLGNLITRVLTLTDRYKGEIRGKSELDKELNIKTIEEKMDKLELHHALDEVWNFIRAANKYMNEKEPWKQEGVELGNTLYNLLEALRIIAILVSPFIPETAERINKQLGVGAVKAGDIKNCKFRPGPFKGRPKKGDYLFTKVK